MHPLWTKESSTAEKSGINDVENIFEVWCLSFKNVLEKNKISLKKTAHQSSIMNVKNHRLATNQLNFQHFSDTFFSVSGFPSLPVARPHRNCKASLAFWRKMASSSVELKAHGSEIVFFQKTPQRFTFLGLQHGALVQMSSLETILGDV